MASNFPIPTKMDTSGDQAENWSFFKDQWLDYEVATGLDKKEDAIRMATLRSLMGRDCLLIFKNLDITDEDRKKPDTAIAALESYFKPTKNEIYERFQFYTCDQGTNESIDQWATRLRNLASTCNFGNSLDSMLRDRLVLGAVDKQATARLFREQDVDLNKAINQLRSSEVAKQQIKDVQGRSSQDHIQYTDTRDRKKKEARPSRANKVSDADAKECKFCNRIHVWGRARCPAFGKTCKRCNQENHFSSSSMCKERGKKKVTEKTNFIKKDNEDDWYSSEDSCFSIEHHVAHLKKGIQQPTVDITFYGEEGVKFQPMSCLLDTGTTCNVMSIDDLCKLVGNPELKASKAKLHLYDGSYMLPLGKHVFGVKTQNGKKKLNSKL